MVDPCPSAVLESNGESLFEDHNITYMLATEAITKTFNADEFVGVSNISVDCGPILIDLINSDGNELDPSIFDNSSLDSFTVL